VERDGSGIIATLPANATDYRDLGVSPDVPYRYVVRATKDGGFSGNSNFVQVVVGTAPPPAPSGADAVPAGSALAKVTWVDNATNESGFRVERSTDGGANWVVAGMAGRNETSFSDVGQPSEQPLCYRVIGFNSSGDSPASNMDCTTLPAAPSDLIAAPGGLMGEINYLGWADNSGVEDGYEVQRTNTPGGFLFYVETIATLGPNATSYSDAVLWGNTYTYRVVALKEGGRSDPSNEATVYGQ
ncbi:MAG TPA: fibronectin type III domain-containing protein, partial [Gemmatimonadales bacterium]